MKAVLTIIILILSFSTIGQDKYFVDYNKYCNKIEFEDLYRLNTRVDAFCLEFNLLSIEITTVLNCGEADTGHFKYSNDTLFLYTQQLPRITINNGDTIYFNGVVECDCLFNIYFDLYGFEKIPHMIYFNAKPIELRNIKYKKRETNYSNGTSEILFDDCGYKYKFIYNKDLKTEKISRFQGNKHQTLIFDKNQKLVEIRTCKYSIDNIKSVKIR